MDKTDQNKSAEVLFFDKFGGASAYDALTETAYERILDEFEKSVEPRSGEVFGDFGCGSAVIASRVKKRFDLRVIGVDITPAMIEHNRSRFSDIEFYAEDIEHTSFEDCSFDIIMFSGVLHHFPTLGNVIKESYRLLKKGGRIFAFDPHYYNPGFWLYRSDRSPISSRKGLTENERLLTRAELLHVLREAGFHGVTVQSGSGVYLKYLESKVGRAFLPFYNGFEFFLHQSGLGRSIGSFLFTSGVK